MEYLNLHLQAKYYDVHRIFSYKYKNLKNCANILIVDFHGFTGFLISYFNAIFMTLLNFSALSES